MYWNLETRETVIYLEGHTHKIKCLDFAKNGKYALSGSEDGTVRYWNLQNGDSIVCLSGSPEWIPRSGRVSYEEQVSDLTKLDGFRITREIDWIMYTPDGYFSATATSGFLVKMTKGMTVYGVDQFALTRNKPDILLQRMEVDEEAFIEQCRTMYRKRLAKVEIDENLTSRQTSPVAEILDYKRMGKNLNLRFYILEPDELQDCVIEMVSGYSKGRQNPTVDWDNIFQKIYFPVASYVD